MNRKIHVSCVAAGALLVSVLGASGAYQYQSFDENPAYVGWDFSSGTVTNTGDPAIGLVGKSLTIPILQSVTNTITSGPNAKVSTDFYTIPTLYASDAGAYPAIDTSATVQFFVDAASSNWVVYSGKAGGGYITNQTTVLAGNVPYPKVVDHTSFHRVTVASDYGTGKFSFFVNDICLATNLNFISAASSSEWFQVQNLGGTAGNVCYLDEYWLTNRVAASEEAPAPIPGGDMSQIDAVYYFETPAPLPVATNATITGTQVAWKFKVEGVGESIVLGGGTTNTITTSNGVLNASGQFTGDMASASKYFYRIIRRSPDLSVTITNAEIYAQYNQGRTTNKTYVVGAPVDIIDGDRTVGGTLGRQLAKGLGALDRMTIYSNAVAYTFTWQAGGTWSGEGTNLVINPGQGVVIEKNSATSNTVVAGLLPTNTVTPITFPTNGFYVVSWPYESAGSLSSFSGLTSNDVATTDYIFLQNGTDAVTAARKVSETEWKTGTRVGGGALYDPVLNAGAGIYLYRHGVGGAWAPVP